MYTELRVNSRSASQLASVVVTIGRNTEFDFVRFEEVKLERQVDLIRVYGSLGTRAIKTLKKLTELVSAIEFIGCDSSTIARVLAVGMWRHIAFVQSVLPTQVAPSNGSSIRIDNCLVPDEALRGLNIDCLTLLTEESGSILTAIDSSHLKRLFIQGGTVGGLPGRPNPGLCLAISHLELSELTLSWVDIDAKMLRNLLQSGPHILRITGKIGTKTLKAEPRHTFPSVLELDVAWARFSGSAAQARFLRLFPALRNITLEGAGISAELAATLRRLEHLVKVSYFVKSHHKGAISLSDTHFSLEVNEST